ncbi:MAG: hypothetical protein IKO78_03730 [Bacilli bacterium]|nr:hypothetical protein [Bacilli bacterium]
MKNFINKIMCIGVIIGLTLQTIPVMALTKDETIYAKLEANGQVDQVIISEHLQGTGKKAKDKTRLQNIENVNGNEKYTIDDGNLTWESNGKDIYYQGTTKEDLQIKLSITYYLNGEKTTIKDMLGKKGTVKMVLKYTNNDSHSVYINGKYETLYTPFVVATTTIIPNTTNKNINVTNGKVINNGTSSVIVLLTTPGLYESLGINNLKGMDTATIEFDTDSFELNSIYALATPKLIDSSDLQVFDKFEGIYSSINTLVDSSNKIKNGSNALLEGANKLSQGVQKIKDGVNSAYQGSNEIKNKLSAAIEALQNDNSAAIDNTTLSYIKNQAKQSAVAGVDAKFTDQYKAGIGANAVAQIKQSSTYQQFQGAISQLEANGITAQLVQSCETITEENQTTCSTYATQIAQYKSALQAMTLMEETARATAISTAEQTAKATAESTAESVSENVAVQVATSAKEKAKTTTTDSLNQLLAGISQLTSGLNELNLGMSSLSTGTGDLKNGISTLDSGIQQFNSQGINKISSVVNGDVKTLEQKVKALAKLSANYKTFDDISNGTDGTSKIIMIVDGISAPERTVTVVNLINKEEQSLWEKIKELFK